MTGAGTNHTIPSLTGGPAVIFVRPQLAVNIGMCARAMANFGLSDLRLVNPREGWPRTGALRKGAYAAAAARCICSNQPGFFRASKRRSPISTAFLRRRRGSAASSSRCWRTNRMDEAAARVSAGEKLGIFFGPERTGLDNEEIALADKSSAFRSIRLMLRSISRRPFFFRLRMDEGRAWQCTAVSAAGALTRGATRNDPSLF